MPRLLDPVLLTHAEKSRSGLGTEDRQTLDQAMNWLRRLQLDGMHGIEIDAFGHDAISDLALRFEELRERLCQ